MSDIDFRENCPDCGGHIGVQKGNPMVASCLDCNWTGNLAVVEDE